MSSKTSQSNNHYLAITTVISAGVLSGCEYCIPVLAALLVLPLIKLATATLINKTKVNTSTTNAHQLAVN